MLCTLLLQLDRVWAAGSFLVITLLDFCLFFA
ncbi:hypothetical protein MTR67_031976 [Solanum verrucosum]|uniref:Uncharacterized protein n=1 Tax=Solanum verrucosum TaxID=315347 RepID=A0AAF0U3L5_SOLVR|nr:hypothetical protein MTR67_031976 [Solanum verrucosum]